MPKKVVISLHGIGKQIDLATKKLTKAKGKTLMKAERQTVNAAIKTLKEIKAALPCPKKPASKSYGIVVTE